MFKITMGKGFHITFKNGYTISVQWGPGNYCDNHHDNNWRNPNLSGEKGSTTAECTIIGPNGGFVVHPGSDEAGVSSYQTPEDVLLLMVWTSIQ
jgi:hypothetical protein